MIFILTILCFATEPELIIKDELFEAANRNIDGYYEACLEIAYNPEDC
jgi:hypothetical protein